MAKTSTKAKAAKAPAAKPKAGTARRAKPKAVTPQRARTPKTPATVTRSDGLREGSGAARMVDLVVKAGDAGVTYDDLCAASGWRECRPAFITACKRAGIALRTDKTVRPMRYFGKYRKGATAA